ncbi:hypothetical protein FQA39_LY13473 [Lamprigera yunnana]|nr:hypothetical protein FQA39_LY13473 [Lamprigera yunnana]
MMIRDKLIINGEEWKEEELMSNEEDTTRIRKNTEENMSRTRKEKDPQMTKALLVHQGKGRKENIEDKPLLEEEDLNTTLQNITKTSRPQYSSKN